MQNAVNNGSENNAEGFCPLLNVDELAAFLNVPKSWVYDQTRRREGGIPHYKVGKYCRFNAQEVLDWMKKGGSAFNN